MLDYPGRVGCTVFCGGCNLRCPFCHNAGLVLNPREFESGEQEVLSYLEKRRGIIEGVCITGGEPLLQPDLGDFIAEVKAMGYLVKLDTNGVLPKKLSPLLEKKLPDYIAMDIKAGPENYDIACGTQVNLEDIKESISLIKNSGLAHEFRTTLVKGIHSPSDIRGIHSLIGSEEQYFLQPFKDSGNLILKGEAFEKTEIDELLSLAKALIPKAELRG